MIKGGKGGDRTLTGLKFESRVSLKDVIVSLPGYTTSGDVVYYQRQKIAELYQKHKIL